MKPYSVWIKQDNVQFRSLYYSHSPMDCLDYGKDKVCHGNNVERIEIRDLDSCVCTLFDRSWPVQS
jgi:hypothetical protein